MNPNPQSEVLSAIDLRLQEITPDQQDPYEYLWQDEGGEG